jgi:hypothetical protein
MKSYIFFSGMNDATIPVLRAEEEYICTYSGKDEVTMPILAEG